jgi:putative transposase
MCVGQRNSRIRPAGVGFEAITSVFPQTVVQTCIVHLIRNSLAFVSWKDRKAILPAIKAIYRAENADMALVRLEEFEAEWGKRYPAIGQAWRRAWEHVVPFFALHLSSAR